MRPKECLELINQISCELQLRYSYVEIDDFLTAVGITKNLSTYDGSNSKRLYAAHLLRNAPNDEILRVAAELEIEVNGTKVVGPPENWRETKNFRLFISHISTHKIKATKLKGALTPHFIDGFVAHEDIHPTEAWQDEVERALYTMDALVAIHTEGFSKSFWTQQELGFALGRGTKIISFSMGEDPTGFVAKHQALRQQDRGPAEIAAEIMRLLRADPRTSLRLQECEKARLEEVGFL